MKKLNVLSMIALGTVMAVGIAHSQVIFSDNFNASALSYDVNAELSNRETGLAGLVQYRECESYDWQTQVGNPNYPGVLFIHPVTNTIPHVWDSPNLDFSSAFPQYKSLQYELKVDPAVDAASDVSALNPRFWFKFGGVQGSTQMSPGYPVINDGIILELCGCANSDGKNPYRITDNGTEITSGLINAHDGMYALKVITNESLAGGYDINFNIDDNSIYSYTRASGFATNYISVSSIVDSQAASNAASAVVDDFNVSVSPAAAPVPEPAGLTGLITGFVTLVGVGFRRKK